MPPLLPVPLPGLGVLVGNSPLDNFVTGAPGGFWRSMTAITLEAFIRTFPGLTNVLARHTPCSKVHQKQGLPYRLFGLNDPSLLNLQCRIPEKTKVNKRGNFHDYPAIAQNQHTTLTGLDPSMSFHTNTVPALDADTSQFQCLELINPTTQMSEKVRKVT